MDDVLAKAEEWRAAGEDVAIATVVGTRRSAPRPLGSKLAVTADGRMFGSVSGGCVEADVCERAKAVIAGTSPELVTYGIGDDEAWSLGLPCGGEIDVFVEPFTAAPPLERGTSYVVVAGKGVGERWHDESAAPDGLARRDGRTVFAERVGPPPRLVAVGAGDIAEALCAIARPLGWHTVVVDPRVRARDARAGAERRRADRRLARRDRGRCRHRGRLAGARGAARPARPSRRGRGGAFYVGALGSKRTQAKRREQLGAVADRVRGPVGLDLGGEIPGRDRARDRRRDPRGS